MQKLAIISLLIGSGLYLTNNQAAAPSNENITSANKTSIARANKELQTVIQKKSIQNLKPPVAKREDKHLKIHGHKRVDPYYWLRDDKRESPDVLAYLNAENDYTQAKLAHTQNLQKTLFKEMTDRLQPDESSVPALKKGYWSWSQFEQGNDYRIHLRKKDQANAKQEILLDQNQRAKGHDYYSLASLSLSSNQNLMAIAEDTVSRRIYTVKIKDLTTGKFLADTIENTSGNLVWANDNKTLFYVKKHPETLLPYQVYRHQLGQPSSQDELVYEEKDDTFYTSIYKTRSEKFIAIHISSTMNSEVRFIAADQPNQKATVFLAREKDHKYEVDHINGQFIVQTDLDAPNEKLMSVAEDKMGSKDHWKTILPHRTDTLLQEVELFDEFLLSNERVEGLEKLRLRNYQGDLIDEITFEAGAYQAGIDNNPDSSAKKLRYYYSSMTTPDSVFEYDIKSKIKKLLKQDKVLGDFDTADYQSERIMISARDGVKVPVSLVYRKDKFSKENKNPLLQYAYGSYGYTIDAGFSIGRLSLLDRGFVFAIAHIRGGKMLGRNWYEEGKKLTKLNTFYDFIDATKALVKQGYANPKQVYAQGGSAGGLLMGGVVNMAPELYHGILAAFPFVDVVTTMLDETIPLTTGEYDEWGNPNDKQFYDYMLSYSPYDQVKAQDYPNMLVVTGLHDSQVQYFEPAKWVAKLRATKTDNNLLLLDTDMQAGHGGKSGRYKGYLDTAKEYGFILDLAGVNN